MPSPGIAQSINGPASFSVTLTYPAAGSTLGETETAVVGTFSGPTNAGIAVNGVLATVQNGNFLVPTLALNAGANTLTITATKLTGETTTATASITQSGAASPLTLTVDRAIGFAPFRAVFHTQIGSLTNNAPVQTVSLDYNGDGTDDILNPTPAADLSYLVAQPGLYRARLTVRDTNNISYTTYRYYIVQSVATHGGMLCDTYGYMRQKLTAQDIPAALNALQTRMRSEFQSAFTALGNNLPSYVATLGTIVNGTLGTDFADYLLVRENPDRSLSGYHLQFSQDILGVWRISDM